MSQWNQARYERLVRLIEIADRNRVAEDRVKARLWAEPDAFDFTEQDRKVLRKMDEAFRK